MAPAPRLIAWPRLPRTAPPDTVEILPSWPLVLLRKWLDPVGAAALGLCALTLFIAATGRLSFLIPALAAAAGLVGSVACRRAYRSGRPLVMPGAAAVLGIVLFLFAVAYPPALGPRYEASRDRAPPESEVRVIPHTPYLDDPGVQSAEWVDAGKASLQQGRVRVEVTEVCVQPGTSAGGELFVRIRMQRTKSGQEIAAGAFAAPLMWDERVRATLRDAAGTTYAQKTLPTGRARGPGPTSASTVTIDVSHELLLFDAPSSVADALRLELPASAWGGTGALRFLIPGAMVRPAPAAARAR
jgi:hypothetical protein